MSNPLPAKEKPISAKKRFVLGILELAKTDPEINALMPKPELRAAVNRPDIPLDRMIATYLDGYGDRPAVAERAYKIVASEDTQKSIRQYLPAYESISYQTLHQRIKNMANAWRYHPDYRVRPEEFVAIIGFTSTDFAVLDFACAYAQTVSIPLQSSTSGADLDEIFANTEPVTLAASINDLVLAAEHAVKHPSIRTLIAFDYDERASEEKAQFAKAKALLKNAKVTTQLVALQNLEAYGKQHPWTFLPSNPQGDEGMTAIVHSSGSTGKPKGAIMPERAVKHTWLGRPTQVPKVTVMFAPLNHIMGRNALIGTLNTGGTAYFTLKPDMSTLFEDIRLARPTFLTFFPRAFELIYQDFQNEVTRRLRTNKKSRSEVETAVKAHMKKTYLGDRLLGGIVGSAPTSPAVRDFIRDCFDILLMDGYGNTESGTGSVTMDGIIQRSTVSEYKLRDVPELGYYTTDKPYPRGELCFKSKWGITGYYKQPEATKGLFDEEGYSLTGDIVEERGPDHVVVIDRRKDVLKLSQGEYVAVGTLGTVFEAGSAVIEQIYIYGNAHRAYLLAVVVPAVEVVEQILGTSYSLAQLKSLVRDELQRVGKKEELKSFEIPRDVIIETEPFSQANGLLSSVRKRLRPALKRKYSAVLEAMYEAHTQGQKAEMEALKAPDSPLTTFNKLVKLLSANLGVQDLDTSKPRNFGELGGDSLGAVQFSNAIYDIFEVSIPANVLLSPTGNLKAWAETIEAEQQSSSNNRPTFSNIHGKSISTVSAEDLELSRFIGEATIQKAAQIADVVEQPNTVLLSGANGFLGHILTLQWLEEVAPRNGKVICLVRAEDDQAARLRLDQMFKGTDAQMEAQYQKLAANHLEVLAADITQPFLGLSTKVFERLAEEVDRICHPAALVNHRFGYEHLFGPNVVGTAEMLRLALTTRKKPIDFISSVAVERFLDNSQGRNEAAPLLRQVKLSQQYAAGYGISKWAGEHLLKKASQQFGLPVNVFRSDMILAHQEFVGQINTADMLTRLLFSIIQTGLAPTSFYKKDLQNPSAKGHYDGVPVDVIAAAVVGVYRYQNKSYQTFNVQNFYQQDGISLDNFVDWVETAGYPTQRLEHSEWFARIKDKLTTLPEAQRSLSALDILMAYSRPYSVKSTSADCRQFKKLVNDLSITVPHLSESYIHKCLTDMKLLEKLGS
ncbi:MAG: thioester reductase domain-containing protein [Bacteroidota bacterium]